MPGKKTITFNDFMKLMEQRYRRSDPDDDLREAFSMFDKKQTGQVNATEFQHVLECIRVTEKLEQDEITEFIDEIDFNKDGNIEYEEFEEVFLMFDRFGDGTVRINEIKDILRICGQNPTNGEVHYIINYYKTQGMRWINFAQFLDIMVKKLIDMGSVSEIRDAFEVFDKNEEGSIDAIVIRHTLENMQLIKVPQKEIDSFMKDLDADGNGKISYEEFLDTMKLADEYLGKVE